MAVLEADEVLLDVEDGKRGGTEKIEGKITFVHRFVTFEATQQESVAFGELNAQYPHRPCILVENPQSTGSFSSALIHLLLSELLGRAQFVKSALIWSK